MTPLAAGWLAAVGFVLLDWRISRRRGAGGRS